MAIEIVRKRSPRAPIISLKEAVDRISKVYEMEGRHPAAADIVAQHLGYKSADNGAAKQLLASLGYYGLTERPAEGMLAVAKSVEEFKYAPDEEHRAGILRKWLATPGVFSDLLQKFHGRLPSAASLKFELINKGFNPVTADECLKAFMESVDYVEKATPRTAAESSATDSPPGKPADEAATKPSTDAGSEQNQAAATGALGTPASGTTAPTAEPVGDQDSDRIPVRLPGGRKAWLVIPSPFYAADKQRLIAQIELLLTKEDEE